MPIAITSTPPSGTGSEAIEGGKRFLKLPQLSTFGHFRFWKHKLSLGSLLHICLNLGRPIKLNFFNLESSRTCSLLTSRPSRSNTSSSRSQFFLKLPLPNFVSCVANRMARLLIVMHNYWHVVSEGCRRTQMEFDHAISLQHGNLTMDFVGALSSNETKETQRKPEFRLIMGLRDLIWFNTVQMDFATIPTPRALFYQINIDFPFLGFFVLLLLFRPFRIVVIAVWITIKIKVSSWYQ